MKHRLFVITQFLIKTLPLNNFAATNETKSPDIQKLVALQYIVAILPRIPSDDRFNLLCHLHGGYQRFHDFLQLLCASKCTSTTVD